jgi:hypothetical protein
VWPTKVRCFSEEAATVAIWAAACGIGDGVPVFSAADSCAGALTCGRTTGFPHLLQNDAVSGLGAPQELQNMHFQSFA